MQVQSPTQSTSAADTSAGSSASALSGAPSESEFLQLLVAQLQHQDPSSPQDPSQFVSELAQFTNLEQTIAIRQDADSIVSNMSSAAAPART